MSAEPVVVAKDISFAFGKTVALDHLSLTIESRKLIGMIGPDGVGKSTLLSLVTGARKMPETGDLQVLGGDMRDREHRNRICPKVAYMPQGLGKNLYFTLTVEENLQFFARLFGHDAAERRRRIDMLTKSTGLARFLDRPAGKLSGGMKQKLGLCCSLIHDPDLLVLDEPTTGVDPLARRQFWDLIDVIREANTNMSVIVATAYMDEAERFEHLIAMDSGKVLTTGTPKELLTRTGKDNLDAAFIELLPESRREGHHEVIVPPLVLSGEDDIAIEATGLTKKFGDFTAVDHVNFKIRRGEIFGFLGSNGCGKSTTMRMLCGLLPATEGEAKLFGKTVSGNTMEMRKHLGYMTQLFSLYGDLTVKQNLELYANLYGIEKELIPEKVDAMMKRFDLDTISDALPKSLPLGIKQRLSLAAAVIHSPSILILDEPTSGVDPVARDGFWELIIELSRKDHVTIFITTHFMNEALRCDRISLMHAGRSLACDTPLQLMKENHCDTLEQAFIKLLEEADPANQVQPEMVIPDPVDEEKKRQNMSPIKRFFQEKFNIQRCYSCGWREWLELMRDPVRATLALFGALLLMLAMGYGITMDVENLHCAVLDNDHSLASQKYIQNITGSPRYFEQHKDVKNYADLERRMKNGELSMVLELPPGFGQDLNRGNTPQIGVWIDGAMPSRAETINGYVNSMHSKWQSEELKNRYPTAANNSLADVEVRYRYNPDVLSLPAMVPAVIPILLLMIPAILAALAVVREKEMGSIINLYVTPITRLEFLLGKQIPYVIFAMISGVLLVLMTVFLFNVPVKGSWLVLILSLFLYSVTSTGMGLLASSITRSQIAVIFMTMLGTVLPATQMCGMIDPVSSQQGAAWVIGTLYPTSYMLLITRGVFNKALGFGDLNVQILCMALAIPVLTVLGVLCQKKQES